MFCLRVFTPVIKEAWHEFSSCATPILLAIILTRANSYSRVLAMLHLSGTVCRHQLESSKLQNEVIYTLKQPDCKKKCDPV